MSARGFDDGSVAGFKFGFWVGNATTTLGVEEIEGHCVEAARSQPAGEHPHESAQLIRSGSVTEHYGHARAVTF